MVEQCCAVRCAAFNELSIHMHQRYPCCTCIRHEEQWRRLMNSEGLRSGTADHEARAVPVLGGEFVGASITTDQRTTQLYPSARLILTTLISPHLSLLHKPGLRANMHCLRPILIFSLLIPMPVSRPAYMDTQTMS